MRLTVSPPSTPNAESSDDEARSRQGSTATSTSSIASGGGSGGLARKRTGGSVLEVVVSVHLTPLKDACGKVGKFVFVLATGI